MGKGKKKKGGKKSEIDTTANTSTKWDGQNQLSIGTRIEWTGSTDNLSSNIRIGTVVEHDIKIDNGTKAPYRIRLDCGTSFLPSDIETKKHIRLSSIKPMTVTFNVRKRVMVKYGNEWFLAHILSYDKDWFEKKDVPPYHVMLDCDEELIRKPFWGPADNIRDCYLSKIPKDPRDMPKLRFKQWDRVEACVGGGLYLPGYINQVWYTIERCDGDGSEAGMRVPYQINVDEGYSIYAKNDNDHSVRKVQVEVGSPLPIAIGDRVECTWVKKNMSESTCIGTVTGHWIQQSDGVIVPYRVILDNGSEVCCNYYKSSIIPSDEPPFELKYGVNDRVDCLLGLDNLGKDVWVSGEVMSCHHDWYKKNTLPYTVRLDNGRTRSFWPTFLVPTATELRFDIGDRVDCHVGNGNGGSDWLPGTVVRTQYTDCSFEDGQVAPYSIQLDRGNHVFPSFDHDSSVKESTVLPPTCWICYDNVQTKDNLIVRECACRGDGGNGFVHVKCLVNLALSKVDGMNKMSLSHCQSAGFNPFSQCITCKAAFDPYSVSFAALTDSCYDLYGTNLKSFWNHLAITNKVALLKHNNDYTGAQKLLETELKRNKKLVATCIQLQKNIPDADMLMAMSAHRVFSYSMELITVHEKTKSLTEMKSALDDALQMVEHEMFDTPANRIRLLLHQAKCSYLCGDKDEALKHSEEAVSLSRALEGGKGDLQTALVTCANYNLHCGNSEIGIGQMSEALKILTRIFGDTDTAVISLKNHLEKIRAGEQKAIPDRMLPK